MGEKLDGLSMDIATAEQEKLRAVFPQCFVEGQLDERKLFELLGTFNTLDENDREKYEFRWKGKQAALQLAGKRSTGTLRPCPEESVDFENTQNLYIEGDNLEVLKLLQTSYYRKVKMIYIDPPYNTGNDFVYADDFADPLARYREVTQQTTKSNPESMGRFHTNWLNMMLPRLRLAANLLRDDGVIFISIDENEVYNLRKLCNEVFGEENYIGTIIWKNATDNNPTQIAIEHEYIVCYAKSRVSTSSIWKSKVSAVKDLLIEIGQQFNQESTNDEELQEKYNRWYRQNKSQLWPLDRYKYIDRGGVYTGSQSVHNPGREGYRYDVIHPVTGQSCVQPLMGYRFPETTMHEMIETGKILFGDDHTKIVEIKLYASEYEEKLASVLELDGRLGSYDIKAIFGEKPIFSNPKPVQLLQRLFSFVLEDGDLMMDFFSGSSTTAEALMNLNDLDSKKRRYICIQLPENLDISVLTADAKAKTIIKNAISFLDEIGKPHTLAEIGKERIRRAGKKLTETNGQQTLDEDKTPLDTGFRVFKLDSSNLKQWDDSPLTGETAVQDFEQRLLGMLEILKPDRSDVDVVYEVMLKLGQDLCEPISAIDLPRRRQVYGVGANVKFIVCLAQNITVEDAAIMSDYAPGRIVFADACFEGSEAKSNVKLTLRDKGITIRVL